MKNNTLSRLIFCSALILGACADFAEAIINSGFMGKGGGYGYPGGGFVISPRVPMLFLDSATHVTDSTFSLWAHVEYDSTVVFESCDIEFQYLETAATTFYETFALKDTVDFRTITAYTFALAVDSLQANTEYIFYGGIQYYDNYASVARQPSSNSITVKTGQ